MTAGGPSVSWVMFDYGGVLAYHPEPHDLALMAGVAGTPVPAFAEAYGRWRRDYDLASLDADGYWRQVGHSLGRGYSAAEMAELTRLDVAAYLRPQAGTVALIEDLARAGCPLAMLSNAPSALAEAITGLPVAPHFCHLIFSCDLKLAKPDPECYAAALARIGAPPDEVIFIDDLSENVAAAAAAGLRAVQFTGPAAARAAVTQQLAGAFTRPG